MGKLIGRLRLGEISGRVSARATVIAGAMLMAVGAGLVYLPAGLMLGGLALVAVGLFLTDVDAPNGGRGR